MTSRRCVGAGPMSALVSAIPGQGVATAGATGAGAPPPPARDATSSQLLCCSSRPLLFGLVPPPFPSLPALAVARSPSLCMTIYMQMDCSSVLDETLAGCLHL
jgi:hypothetical protein